MPKGIRAETSEKTEEFILAIGYYLTPIRLFQRDLSSLICHLPPCHALDTLLCCLLTE